jgi:hypothetical protein
MNNIHWNFKVPSADNNSARDIAKVLWINETSLGDSDGSDLEQHINATTVGDSTAPEAEYQMKKAALGDSTGLNQNIISIQLLQEMWNKMSLFWSRTAYQGNHSRWFHSFWRSAAS